MVAIIVCRNRALEFSRAITIECENKKKKITLANENVVLLPHIRYIVETCTCAMPRIPIDVSFWNIALPFFNAFPTIF